MNNHRPDLYTEQLWAARRLREYAGTSIWSVLIWALVVIITIGVIGSWFVPK
jgi:hypothetical protein